MIDRDGSCSKSSPPEGPDRWQGFDATIRAFACCLALGERQTSARRFSWGKGAVVSRLYLAPPMT